VEGSGTDRTRGSRLAVCLFLAAVVAAAVLARPTTAAADPALTFGSHTSVGDLQGQARQVRAEIARLDDRLARSVEEYDAARAKLDALNAQLADARTDLLGAQAKLDVAQAVLGARLAQMYKTGRPSLIDVLLGSSSLTELSVQLDFFHRITQADEDSVAQIDALTRQVAALEQSITTQRDQALKDELDVREKRAVVEDQLAQRKAVLRDLDGRIKTMLARERRAAAQAAARLARAAGVNLESINGSAAQVAVIREAMRWLGVDYVWGGASPQGFDCSGLVTYVYAKFGVVLPHAATLQADLGTPVPFDELQPADLVFFGGPYRYHHVGIYAGNGLFIEAPHTGDVVKVSVLAGRGAALACRYPVRLP
jgi:cell wall-associated NlpC family hydrolase